MLVIRFHIVVYLFHCVPFHSHSSAPSSCTTPHPRPSVNDSTYSIISVLWIRIIAAAVRVQQQSLLWPLEDSWMKNYAWLSLRVRALYNIVERWLSARRCAGTGPRAGVRLRPSAVPGHTATLCQLCPLLISPASPCPSVSVCLTAFPSNRLIS